MKKRKSKAATVGGLVFVGSLMIGIAFGMIYGNTAVGALLGLGVGFILQAIIRLKMKG